MVYCRKTKIIVILFIILFIVFAPEFVFATDAISIDNNYGASYDLELPSWVDSNNYYYIFGYKSYVGSYSTESNPNFNYFFAVSTIPFDIQYGDPYNRLYGNLYYYYCSTVWDWFKSDEHYNVTNMSEPSNFSSNCLVPDGLFSMQSSDFHIIANHTILEHGSDNIIYQPESSVISPEIVTSSSDLENLNFKNLEIDLNDYQGQDVYLLTYDRTNTTNIEDDNGNIIDYNALYTDMISDVLGLYNSSSEYANEDDLVKLYPRKEILLNSDSKYYKGELVDDGERYLIPIDELGLSFKVNGTYGFRFAIREHINGGGGFRDVDWAYTYLTDTQEFTVIKNMSGLTTDEIEKQAKEKQHQQEREEDKKLQQEQTNAIRDQTAQDGEFYNNILSNDYDENKAGDTFSGTTSSTDDIDNSEYTGLFSAIFGKFSNIINGNYNSVEIIQYPVPNTDKKITITSDLLSSKIQGTFIYTFLQAFWIFLFGMYIFKFSNNLIRKIKDGSILNGYENNDEVITSTML